MSANERVLEALKKAKNKGISFKDFPKGRAKGHMIVTNREYMRNGRNWFARYVLIK